MPLPPSGARLLVSETFVSLQGEGVTLGRPAAFLRLGGCNLECSYCDTAYTWDERRYDLSSELRAVPSEELERFIVDQAPGRLIITGGEPLIQQKKLVGLLRSVDARLAVRRESPLVIEVETNGTIAPLAALVERVDQWNVSPKLSVSGEPLDRRCREDALASFVRLPQATFKFVVRSDDDVREVERLCLDFGIERDRVLLMPEADNPRLLAERSPDVARWAIERGLRFTTRLHLQLYGGRRGT